MSLRVGPREGGVPKIKKTKPTKARTKYAQGAAPDFFAQKGAKGQLELLKLLEKWGTK